MHLILYNTQMCFLYRNNTVERSVNSAVIRLGAEQIKTKTFQLHLVFSVNKRKKVITKSKRVEGG